MKGCKGKRRPFSKAASKKQTILGTRHFWRAFLFIAINFYYLQSEKNELREEKLLLKAEKERIEQQMKSISAPAAGFLPTHPAATYHAGANKPDVFPGYGLFPMWQYIPSSALDTSHDHELRPPAA